MADKLNFNIITIGGILTVILGFLSQSILVSLYVSLGSLVAALLLIVPAWGKFNQHPVKWLEPRGLENVGEIRVDMSSVPTQSSSGGCCGSC